MSASPNFASIADFERWAQQQGVHVEVFGLLGSPHTLTLNWIERQPEAPKGAAAPVIQALLAMADAHQQAVDLMCLGGLLEPYYNRFGFVAEAENVCDETGDVVMVRPVGGPPALEVEPTPQRRRGRRPG